MIRNRVSVVIPIFNGWELTKNCLSSLHASMTEDIAEVIVVDNASRDGSVEQCPLLGQKLFGDAFIFLRQDRNRNFAPACNIGARAARGDLLFFLNNDTVCAPGWLPPLLRRLEEDPSLGGVGPLLLYPSFGPYRDRVQHLGIVFSPTLAPGHLYEGFPASHPAVRRRRRFQAITGAALLTPKALFDEVGGFDEEFVNGFEDIDLCVRMGQKGRFFSCEPDSLIYHLAGQTPGRHGRDEQNARLFRRKSCPQLRPDQHEHVRRDGFVFRLSPWLWGEIAPQPHIEEGLARLLEQNPDEGRMEAMLEAEPLWASGYWRLAEQKAAAGKREEAAALLRMLTLTLPDHPEYVLRRYAFAAASNAEQDPQEREFLLRHVESLEFFIHYARRLHDVLTRSGLADLAEQARRFLDDPDRFSKQTLLPLFQRMAQAGFFNSNWMLSPFCYTAWIEVVEKPAEKAFKSAALAWMGEGSSISVIMPVYNPAPEHLREAVASVRAQSYPHWELCIADDASTNPEVHAFLNACAQEDARIRVTFREQNGHISEASNSALAMAAFPWAALLDHDDCLTENALLHVAGGIRAHPEALLFYSDEDKLDGKKRHKPYFKPDFDPDLLRCQNFISHLGVYRTDRLRLLGGFRKGFEGSQDYDLALRYVEGLPPQAVAHIPHVLYHWRIHAQSTAGRMSVKPYAVQAGRQAAQEHLRRLGLTGCVEESPSPARHRVRWAAPRPMPAVSLILLCRQGLYPAPLLRALHENPATNGCEIIAAPLGGLWVFPPGIKAARYVVQLEPQKDEHPAALRNRAAGRASGTILGFLDSDLLPFPADHPEQGSWLDQAAAECLRNEIGATGGLIWDDKQARCAGYAPDEQGFLFPFLRGQEYRKRPFVFFGQLVLSRRVQALSADNLFCRKAVWEEAGGFDPAFGNWADADFCLRLWSSGKSLLFSPFLQFHSEASAPEKGGQEALHRRWGEILRRSPFRNPHCASTGTEWRLQYTENN